MRYKIYSGLQPVHCLVILDFKNDLFDALQSDNGIHQFRMVHFPSNEPMSDLHLYICISS